MHLRKQHGLSHGLTAKFSTMDHSQHQHDHSAMMLMTSSNSVFEAASAADDGQGFCHGSGMIMYMDGACVTLVFWLHMITFASWI